MRAHAAIRPDSHPEEHERIRTRAGLRRAWSGPDVYTQKSACRIHGGRDLLMLERALRTRQVLEPYLTAALREDTLRHRRLPGQPSDWRAQFPEHSAATGSPRSSSA